MEPARQILVARRFRGPADSANGGYFSGLVAACSDVPVTIRLHAPPPLETPMTVERAAGGEGELRVQHADRLIATTRRADSMDFGFRQPPTYSQALEVSAQFADQHLNYEECFVCGRTRERGDALRLQPAPWQDRVVVPWIPHRSLDGGDGKVAPEFMSAALDCPGYYSIGSQVPMLLGEFSVHIDRRVHVGEPCVVVGWRIANEGRKHEVATMLFDEEGEPCARARGLWIAPRA